MNYYRRNGSAAIWIVITVLIVFIAGIGVWFFLRNQYRPPVVSQTETNQPSVKVTDLSGGVPPNQTTAVLVEHSDSTFEKFILSNGAADSFVAHLPAGDHLISKTPLK